MATITGNNLNNVLIGTTGADKLSGLGGQDTLNGGLGNDVLIGGTGNDVYYVDSVGDKIEEPTSLGGDRDQVRSTISINLTALGSGRIEAATLLGTDAINATGNSLANTLTGNSANNKLLGQTGTDTLIGGLGDDTLDGGSGDDVLMGGAGNDRYVINSLLDVINE